MFISEEIPTNFNKVAELHDNYVILVKEDVLTSGRTYEAYIQFFNPSTTYEHLTNYRISDGNDIKYNYHYTNNQYYSYIDYMQVAYTKNTYEITRDTDLWARFDVSSVALIVGLLLALVIIIVNLATSLVHRGGIFHA